MAVAAFRVVCSIFSLHMTINALLFEAVLELFVRTEAKAVAGITVQDFIVMAIPAGVDSREIRSGVVRFRIEASCAAMPGRNPLCLIDLRRTGMVAESGVNISICCAGSA